MPAATGGIIGALTEAGVSKEDASRYAKGNPPRRDLGIARVPEQDRSRLDVVLNESAVNLQDRSTAWQNSGWTGFGAASSPLTVDDVRRERELGRAPEDKSAHLEYLLVIDHPASRRGDFYPRFDLHNVATAGAPFSRRRSGTLLNTVNAQLAIAALLVSRLVPLPIPAPSGFMSAVSALRRAATD